MNNESIDTRLENSKVFSSRRLWKDTAVMPFSLNVVDCYFIFNGFSSESDGKSKVSVLRTSNMAVQKEVIELKDSFDLYSAVREAEGVEVLFTGIAGDAFMYLDSNEGFILIGGSSQFIRIAKPYPEQVEQHRYIEAMLGLEDQVHPASPEEMFGILKNFLSR